MTISIWAGIGAGAGGLLCICACCLVAGCCVYVHCYKRRETQRDKSSTTIVNKDSNAAIVHHNKTIHAQTFFENHGSHAQITVTTAGSAASVTKSGRQHRHDSDDESTEEQANSKLKRKQPPSELIVVRNALVLSIGLSEYDHMSALPGVTTDIERYRKLWKREYNYRVIPDKDDDDAQQWFNKTRWSYDEIEEFVEKKRNEMRALDGSLEYDCLIVTINGHGKKEGLLPSEHNSRDEKDNGPVRYDFLQGLVTGAAGSTIPRIFIVDACRGSMGGGAMNARDGDEYVHVDALACSVFGNSPGYKVNEHAAKGGNFSQCFIAELAKSKDADTATLSSITSRVGKALQKLSHWEQTCWMEGDSQCHNVVFMPNKSK